MDVVGVGVECLAEVAVDVQRIGIGDSKRRQITIGISKVAGRRVTIFVIHVEANNFVHVVEQAVAIGIGLRGGQASLLSLTMARLNRIADSIAIAVQIKVIDRSHAVGVDRSQTGFRDCHVEPVRIHDLSRCRATVEHNLNRVGCAVLQVSQSTEAESLELSSSV